LSAFIGLDFQGIVEGERRVQLSIPEEFDNPAMHEQLTILVQALGVYVDRNRRYKDNWRRFGWRGCLFRLRERAERAWDDLWDAHTPRTRPPEDAFRFEPADVHTDDLIDLINFAAFTIRAIRENNRDGEGKWW
jgi:hypothetical protein